MEGGGQIPFFSVCHLMLSLCLFTTWFTWQFSPPRRTWTHDLKTPRIHAEVHWSKNSVLTHWVFLLGMFSLLYCTYQWNMLSHLNKGWNVKLCWQFRANKGYVFIAIFWPVSSPTCWVCPLHIDLLLIPFFIFFCNMYSNLKRVTDFASCELNDKSLCYKRQ